MIPCFHVCGTYTDVRAAARVLIIGGWASPETVTLRHREAACRHGGAPECRRRSRSHRLSAANLELTRRSFLDQTTIRQRCWENSSCSHIRVMENELRR